VRLRPLGHLSVRIGKQSSEIRIAAAQRDFFVEIVTLAYEDLVFHICRSGVGQKRRGVEAFRVRSAPLEQRLGSPAYPSQIGFTFLSSHSFGSSRYNLSVTGIALVPFGNAISIDVFDLKSLRDDSRPMPSIVF
jgi:hypothetical protein